MSNKHSHQVLIYELLILLEIQVEMLVWMNWLWWRNRRDGSLLLWWLGWFWWRFSLFSLPLNDSLHIGLCDYLLKGLLLHFLWVGWLWLSELCHQQLLIVFILLCAWVFVELDLQIDQIWLYRDQSHAC